MAVLYKLYQDNRSNATYPGKWYAKAVQPETIDLDGLAEIIEKMCTATDADIYAVLKSLISTIRRELLAGRAVKLNGLGLFRLGLRTKPADSAADFSVQKNVVGYRVNFMPEARGGNIKGSRKMHYLYDGAQAQEAPKNSVDTSKKPTSTTPQQP